MVDLQLSIVDRLIEVTTLVRTAEINNKLRTTDKPILLYSAQVFGSGKSTFGVNAISLLKDPAVAHALLNPPPKPGTTERSRPFTQELVDAYSNTRTVFVDISHDLAVSGHCIPVEQHITFREALFYALYRAAVNDTDPLNYYQFISNVRVVNAESLMQLLVEKTGHKGKWLFFIDEIGVIDRMASDYDDIKNPAKYLNIKPQHIDGYTHLFDILCPFLRRCDTFVFCAGKSASLTEKSLEESGSPVRLRLLAMSNLHSQNIVDVIHKTTYEGQPLQQALGLPDDLLLSFAEIVFRYTGGIPRLVHRAFESLLGLATPIQDTDTIEKLMNGKVREDIVVDTSCFFPPKNLSVDATQVYSTLLLMHVFRIKIKKSLVIKVGNASTKYALDWVSNLCLYISPDGPDTYRLVFSQYVIDYLQSFPPNDNQQISYLVGLLKQLGNFPAFVDQGRILEVMVAQSLACRLAFATTFGEIPGLQQTLLSNVAVPSRGVGQGFGIQFLPSFQPKTTIGKPTVDGHGATKSYSPTDWHQFFLDLVKSDHMNAVGIARKQNSNGPDLILPSQVAADSTQLPANFYCLGIAVKNLQAEGSTNWVSVSDEITKGLTVPLQNAALKSSLRAVLVIASTRLMQEIEDVISPNLIAYLALALGATTSNHEFKNITATGLWKLKFTVPERGELVILTEGGMTALLGNDALTALSNYFTHSNDEQCKNLISLGNSFGALAWNRKGDSTTSTTTTNEHKRKLEDDDDADGPARRVFTSRILKLKFVEKDSRNELGEPTIVNNIPVGTMLPEATTIIHRAFSKQNPSIQGLFVVGIEWEGIPIVHDEHLDMLHHRDELVVLIQ